MIRKFSLGPEVVRSQLGVVDLHHQAGVLRLAAQDLEDPKRSRVSLAVFQQQQSLRIQLYGRRRMK